MYNFKKFPGVTPPDPQHWLGGEGVKPPSGEILATGLVGGVEQQDAQHQL